jgi:hypothetical protein
MTYRKGVMKNVQVIDSADNCVYDVFQLTSDDFALLFGSDSDIAFAGDFDARDDLEPVFARMWASRIPKALAQGIHGTYFIGLEPKAKYYPTRKDEDAVNPDGTKCR